MIIYLSANLSWRYRNCLCFDIVHFCSPLPCLHRGKLLQQVQDYRRLHLSTSPFYLWKRDSDYEIYMLITRFILVKQLNLCTGTYHKVQDLRLICHGNLAGHCTRNVNLCSCHRCTGTAPQDSSGVDRLGAHLSHRDNPSARHISTRWECTYKEKAVCSLLRIWFYRCTTILTAQKTVLS